MRISRRRLSICGNNPIHPIDVLEYEMVGHEVLGFRIVHSTVGTGSAQRGFGSKQPGVMQRIQICNKVATTTSPQQRRKDIG